MAKSAKSACRATGVNMVTLSPSHWAPIIRTKTPDNSSRENARIQLRGTELGSSCTGAESFVLLLPPSTESNNKANGENSHESKKRINVCPPTVNRSKQRTNKNTLHFAKLGLYAELLWTDNLITDTIVRVEEYTFNAHRAVLSCYSPYLTRKLTEHDEDKVELVGISPAIFKILLNFMYTGELKVNCQTLPDVFYGARKLEMRDVLEKCSQKLRGSSVETFLYMYVAAKKLGMPDKWKQSFELILRHFEEIVCTSEFLELDADQVCEVLSGDPIAARSEIVMFLGALKWIAHNHMTRERHAVRVLSCVRFPLMTQREILHCFHPPIEADIMEMRDIRIMLLSALCYVTAENFGFQEYFKDFSCLPREYLIEGEISELWDLSCPKSIPSDTWSRGDLEMKSSQSVEVGKGIKN